MYEIFLLLPALMMWMEDIRLLCFNMLMISMRINRQHYIIWFYLYQIYQYILGLHTQNIVSYIGEISKIFASLIIT